MLFSQSCFCECDLPLDRTISMLERLQSLVRGTAPRINPQLVSLGYVKRDSETSASCRGSYGSFEPAFRSTERLENGKPITSAEMILKISHLMFLPLCLFLGLFSILAFTSPYVSTGQAFGMMLFLWLVVLGTVFLIAVLALPSAFERLELLFRQAFME